MRLLDGLKGVDFSGIGDQESDNDMFGVFSYNVNDAMGTSNLVSAYPSQAPAASYGPYGPDNNFAAASNFDTRNSAASIVDTDVQKAGSDIAKFLGLKPSVPSSSGVDTSLDFSHPGTSSYNTTTGKFNYTQGQVFQKPASVVDSIVNDVKSVVSSVAPSLVSSPASPARPSSPTVPASYRAPSAASASSFTSDFNAITNGILSIVAPIAAAKQQKQQARAAAGPRGAAGSRGVKGSAGAASSSMNTYLLIGGGALVVGLLVYMVAKD